MKILNGRESSILALIAQTPNLSRKDKDRILSALEGDALRIAKVMVGDIKNPTPHEKEISDSFYNWVKNLSK